MQRAVDQPVRVHRGVGHALAADEVENLAAPERERRCADRPPCTHPAAQRPRLLLRAWGCLQSAPRRINLSRTADNEPDGRPPRRIAQEAIARSYRAGAISDI